MCIYMNKFSHCCHMAAPVKQVRNTDLYTHIHTRIHTKKRYNYTSMCIYMRKHISIYRQRCVVSFGSFGSKKRCIHVHIQVQRQSFVYVNL